MIHQADLRGKTLHRQNSRAVCSDDPPCFSSFDPMGCWKIRPAYWIREDLSQFQYLESVSQQVSDPEFCKTPEILRGHVNCLSKWHPQKKHPARLQHPSHLLDSGKRVVHMLQNSAAIDAIKGFIRQLRHGPYIQCQIAVEFLGYFGRRIRIGHRKISSVEIPLSVRIVPAADRQHPAADVPAMKTQPTVALRPGARGGERPPATPDLENSDSMRVRSVMSSP